MSLSPNTFDVLVPVCPVQTEQDDLTLRVEQSPRTPSSSNTIGTLPTACVSLGEGSRA